MVDKNVTPQTQHILFTITYGAIYRIFYNYFLFLSEHSFFVVHIQNLISFLMCTNKDVLREDNLFNYR